MNAKRSHTLKPLRGPTVSSDRGTMGTGEEIKGPNNRGEGMADADGAEKNGIKVERKGSGPRHWPHRGTVNRKGGLGEASTQS